MRKEIERFIAGDVDADVVVGCWRSFFFQTSRFVIVNWFDRSDIFNQQSDIISVESTLKGMYFLHWNELINGKFSPDVAVAQVESQHLRLWFGQWENKS